MDRNSIIGIIIIVGILVVWAVVNQPNKDELARRQYIADSLSRVKQEQTNEEVARQLHEETKEQASVDSVAGPVSIEDLHHRYGEFAGTASGSDEFYTMENDLLKLTISTKGGRPYTAELKNYQTYDSLPLLLFTGDSTIFGLNFYYQNKLIFTNDLYFKPRTENKNIRVTADSASLTMRLQIAEDKYIEYVYTMHKGTYMVNFRAYIRGLQDIYTKPGTIDLTWELLSPQQERGKQNENNYTTLYYKPFEEDVEYFNARTNKPEQELDLSTKVEWIAFKDQFFSSVIIANNAFDNALLKTSKMPETSDYIKNFRAVIGLPYDADSQEPLSFKFYFGPNKFKLLKKYKDSQLQDLVTVGKGIIKWINQYVIIVIFDWLSRFIGNYGIIILLLTIIIKIGLLPLTYRSYLSQAKMRVLKPQIDELTKKYPKGKEMEKQQATMALYKKAGASPLGGCLPQLLQFPILFAMFRFFPTSIELRQESFLWATDLSTYDSILSLPFKVPLGYGDHVSLFTLLMTVSTIITMRVSNQTTASSQQMPGMKTMMYIMPVMFMFFLNNFSAALTYYYFLANLITFGQNWLFKQFIDENDLLKKMEARKAKPQKKSSLQKRLEDMARQRSGKSPRKR